MKNTKIKNRNMITFVVPCEDGDAIELSYKPEEAQRISLHSTEINELINQCIPVAVSSDYDLLVLDY